LAEAIGENEKNIATFEVVYNRGRSKALASRVEF
jgi:hypothetical protein